MCEEWRTVAGYEGIYEVSNHGNVRSLRFNKVKYLHKQKRKDNRYKVALWKDSIRKDIAIHRLVATAFVVQNDKSHVIVNHLDGNPSNNNSSNLEWTTQSGNIQHAWDTGLNKVTEKRRSASKQTRYKHGKLNWDKVADIRRLLVEDTHSIGELAEVYGIDRSVISRIKSNKAWVVDADI